MASYVAVIWGSIGAQSVSRWGQVSCIMRWGSHSAGMRRNVFFISSDFLVAKLTNNYQLGIAEYGFFSP
jgi:hypothetical protein